MSDDSTQFIKRTQKMLPCVSIIGMAGSGKTTTGMALAERLGWAFMDTDSLIESAYGARLQDISESLDCDAFLDMEAEMICSIRASRTVIATGGSVVYRQSSMEHLKKIGPIVCLDAPLEVVVQRISLNPERGLVIAEGQTIADLYRERMALYNTYADIHCDATRFPSEIAKFLTEKLHF